MGSGTSGPLRWRRLWLTFPRFWLADCRGRSLLNISEVEGLQAKNILNLLWPNMMLFQIVMCNLLWWQKKLWKHWKWSVFHSSNWFWSLAVGVQKILGSAAECASIQPNPSNELDGFTNLKLGTSVNPLRIKLTLIQWNHLQNDPLAQPNLRQVRSLNSWDFSGTSGCANPLCLELLYITLSNQVQMWT